MHRKFLILFLLAKVCIAHAGLRISIITCDPGRDLYSIYGHSAIRVQDSVSGSDLVYNYGTFDFNEPNFYWKFTRGKLNYYLDADTYERFRMVYDYDNRAIHEQTLILDSLSAFRIDSFLKWNIKPENRYYLYDFLYDNCSTRIRDIFTKLFGSRFKYGEVLNGEQSFRQILNRYESDLHWERMGINFLMSNEVDKKMNNHAAMFLPDYLYKGFSTATLDGQFILSGNHPSSLNRTFKATQTNIPLLAFGGLLIVYLILNRIQSLRRYLIYFDVLFFLILGLLGFLILFMWFGTNHQVCRSNFNLLWCFPLHVLFAYLLARKSEKTKVYARLASYLVLLFAFYMLFLSDYTIDLEWWPLVILTYLRLRYYAASDLSAASWFINFKTYNPNR